MLALWLSIKSRSKRHAACSDLNNQAVMMQMTFLGVHIIKIHIHFRPGGAGLALIFSVIPDFAQHDPSWQKQADRCGAQPLIQLQSGWRYIIQA